MRGERSQDQICIDSIKLKSAPVGTGPSPIPMDNQHDPYASSCLCNPGPSSRIK